LGFLFGLGVGAWVEECAAVGFFVSCRLFCFGGTLAVGLAVACVGVMLVGFFKFFVL